MISSYLIVNNITNLIILSLKAKMFTCLYNDDACVVLATFLSVFIFFVSTMGGLIIIINIIILLMKTCHKIINFRSLPISSKTVK